ncbi:MAG: spore coat protein CotJB [Oscillospiraceae bacterium]|nr:spore coat protein CotJB [Oscillospiraceae bacterium]
MAEKNNAEACGYKNGVLPACAPLAVGYVPDQSDAQPRYEAPKALARGTLFPGLDLPLRNMANQSVPNVPLAELMAIDFAAHDLSLYLDTHPRDEEAFAVYRDLLRLAEEGSRRYAARYGPISKPDLIEADKFEWLNSPWPWELCEKGEN